MNQLLSEVTKVAILKASKNLGPAYTVQFEVHSELTEQRAVESFCKALQCENYPSASLRTGYKYIFELTRFNQVIEVGYLGHGYIRLSQNGRDTDYKLVNPRLLITCLENVGLSDPDKWQAIAEKKQREKRWSEEEEGLNSLPSMLKNDNGEIKKEYLMAEAFPHYDQLLKEYADEGQMLKQFFGMLLSSAEEISWKVSSALHQLLVKILLQTNIKEIEALIADDLTAGQKEGIAKFLTCAAFQQTRKEDLTQIEKSKKKIIMSFLQRQGMGPKIRSFRQKVMS